MQPEYKVYPSLLDAYAWYKKSESSTCKQELVDKINRIPFKSEAADRGTAFNVLIDSILNCAYDKIYEPVTKFDGFEFKTPIINQFVNELTGSVPQVYVEATIETDNGIVLLYGYADEVKEDMCLDIKTTKQYEFPKFIHNWQHVIYPYCLNEMGIECNNFRYLITDFNSIFKEDYKYEKNKIINKLKAELNDFTFFLEMNREIITDTKIFGADVQTRHLNAEYHA